MDKDKGPVSKLALSSYIVSIVSLILLVSMISMDLLSIGHYFSVPIWLLPLLSLSGAILGIAGQIYIKKENLSGKNLAITGTVISIFIMLIVTVGFYLTRAMFSVVTAS